MSDLKSELETLKSDAEQYFTDSIRALQEAGHDGAFISYTDAELWELLPETQRHAGEGLRRRTVRLGADILDAAKLATLLSPADAADIRLDLRRMAASLRFREFEHSAPYAITEEDRVFGIIPEEQSERRTHISTPWVTFRGLPIGCWKS
jgi:hypothetical protein